MRLFVLLSHPAATCGVYQSPAAPGPPPQPFKPWASAVKVMKADNGKFFNYFRMTYPIFQELLAQLEAMIDMAAGPACCVLECSCESSHCH